MQALCAHWPFQGGSRHSRCNHNGSRGAKLSLRYYSSSGMGIFAACQPARNHGLIDSQRTHPSLDGIDNVVGSNEWRWIAGFTGGLFAIFQHHEQDRIVDSRCTMARRRATFLPSSICCTYICRGGTNQVFHRFSPSSCSTRESILGRAPYRPCAWHLNIASEIHHVKLSLR